MELVPGLESWAGAPNELGWRNALMLKRRVQRGWNKVYSFGGIVGREVGGLRPAPGRPIFAEASKGCSSDSARAVPAPYALLVDC